MTRTRASENRAGTEGSLENINGRSSGDVAGVRRSVQFIEPVAPAGEGQSLARPPRHLRHEEQPVMLVVAIKRGPDLLERSNADETNVAGNDQGCLSRRRGGPEPFVSEQERAPAATALGSRGASAVDARQQDRSRHRAEHAPIVDQPPHHFFDLINAGTIGPLPPDEDQSAAS